MIEQINIVGPVTGFTGYGIHTLELTNALQQLTRISLSARSQVDSSARQFSGINKALLTPFDYNKPTVCIWFADCMHLFTGKPRVGFPVFETNKLNKTECYHLSNLDTVFVTSKWAAQVVNDSLGSYGWGVDVVVVREGFNDSIFKPFKTAETNITIGWKRPYIQNIGKWEIRKGHPVLIRALGELANDGAEFTFIGHWNNVFQQDWLQVADRHLSAAGFIKVKEGLYKQSNGTIVLSGRLSSHSDIATIINMCDFGVYPHRAEGWGLPILETMACGKPVIATNYSGPSEYLTPECGILLEPDGFEEIYDPTFFPNGREGSWANINLNSLKHAIAAMINCSDDQRFAIGIKAFEQASGFTWGKSAEIIFKHLTPG